MKHLYFIRHGQSEANINDVCCGRLDSPLIKKDIDQAISAGKDIAKSGITFDVIITSPLTRAHDTAKYVAKHVGHNLELIELENNLLERDFGDVENKNLTEHFGIDIDEYYEDERLIDSLPNVESLKDLHERAQGLLDSVKRREEESILVVAHGAFANSLFRAVAGDSYFKTG